MRQFESHGIINKVVEPNKERGFQIQTNHEFFVQIDSLKFLRQLSVL